MAFKTTWIDPITTFTFPNKAIQLLNSTITNTAKQLTQAGLFSVSDLIYESNQKNQINNNNINSYNFATTNGIQTPANFNAYFGQQIINISFLPTKFIDENGINSTTTQLDLPFCFMNIDFDQLIIETPVMNNTGTIKEIYAQSDYHVNITGGIVGNFGTPTANNPLQGHNTIDINTLINLAKTQVPIRVASSYLNMFDIEFLLIKHLNVPQKATGFVNIQNFTLECISDNDNLTII